MKIEIRVGEATKRIEYPKIKLDDIKKEKERMYNFLLDSNDSILENVDNFLLYTLNNCLLSDNIEENVNSPKLNRNDYKIFQINDDGSEILLNNNEYGGINKNYYNDLMKSIMDDFYESLNFYK